MSATVLKLLRDGQPATLIENLGDLADDIEFMAVVRVMKNGEIWHDWSELPNNLTALGAVETLRDALLDPIRG